MSGITLQNYASDAALAVRQFRHETDPHWNDSYLNMGAALAQQAMENDYNMKLWELNNEYNSPVSQMQRFKEAGLNPMLIYQQGTPGNSASPAASSHAQYTLTPHADTGQRISQASQIIGMVTQLCKNIGDIYGQGMDLQLKQNEVAASNFDRAVMEHSFPYSPGVVPGVNYANLESILNPFSKSFDPLAYLAFSKHGQLPQFLNTYLSGESLRQLQGFRSQYQEYYNKYLLPKFNEYQAGKIGIQAIEKEMAEYQKKMMLMIPPQLRGILEPVLGWIAPFLKFIFKRSTINVNTP